MPTQRGRKRSAPTGEAGHFKLCGFLQAVLAVELSTENDASVSPEKLTASLVGIPCSLHARGSDVSFLTETGVTLVPVARDGPENSVSVSGSRQETPEPLLGKPQIECQDSDGAELVTPRPRDGPSSSGTGVQQISGGSRSVAGGNNHNCSSNSNNVPGRKRRKLGFVHGSMSVIHQIDALTMHNCLQIKGLVVRVSIRGQELRGVVLVDVYLPLALFLGQQFWKPGTTAAAVLNHLSCDWDARKKLFGGATNHKPCIEGDDQDMWNLCDCHVVGCKMHGKLSDLDKRVMFDLHEVFKSLPALDNGGKSYSTSIKPAKHPKGSGIWDVPNDVLISMFSELMPRDLLSVAATCQHMRLLAVSVMPCMNLKLFPHQQAAVEWMLQRERSPQVLAHPLFLNMQTEDGFQFFVNVVSGELSPGMAPTMTDFRGGMFCDEPGLGKTVTALSLVLKAQGTLAAPPEGVRVKWCEHSSGLRYGYYEISASNCSVGHIMPMWKKCMALEARRGRMLLGSCSPENSVEGSLYSSLTTPPSKRSKLMVSPSHTGSVTSARDKSALFPSLNLQQSLPTTQSVRCTRSFSQIKKNLLEIYEETAATSSQGVGRRTRQHRRPHTIWNGSYKADQLSKPRRSSLRLNGNNRKLKMGLVESSESDETWVQCDACGKWRKLPDEAGTPDDSLAWFCSMNKDVLRQKCSVPEEHWDSSRSIVYLPGFYNEGELPGQERNICFFTSVLKEYAALLNSETKQALTWLANLTSDKLLKMETTGLTLPPGLRMVSVSGQDLHGYYKIFEAFGLVQSKEGKGVTRWHYPCGLDNLVLDLVALKISLTRPVDVIRLYLSRATLVVVPPNLVEHWKNQISKHIRPGQLRVFIWIDQKKPPLAHNLAWDYDVVITTFPRLSAEWSLRESSVLMRVHWLRVMLDEGHTLGSSVCLTNKLQMAVSLTATCRWLLTGTPTPNTPNSQVAHLQVMLKFLHEEAYGYHQKSWEAGILRPFGAEMEEGRARLLQLLQRCMISARKADLRTIPVCIKKVTLLHFTEEHARSYNDLVVQVRRNILMADWNDPSHVESLLNPKQWKFRSNTIRNVRLSCCVAGHIKVRNAGEDIQETMDILVHQGLDPTSEDYVIIKYGLLNGGNCFRCHEWCRLPVITPCRHLLCLDCVSLDSEKCTLRGCGNAYKMQSPENLARPENPNPKWRVPQDLIELQPSYNQENWDPDWHATSSSKVAYLVERLNILQAANREMGYCLENDDHSKQNEEGRLLDQRNSNTASGQTGDKVPELLENSHRKLPEKAIIFSQFLEHINVIEQQLTRAGISYAGMYSPMHSSNKMKSLMMFQHDENCMALVMDGSAALGLDLSFVTHVFLMEPIWDRSMEEQVISRAHRMGATRPIYVETLAMCGTIEEQMLEFLQDPVDNRRALQQDTHTSNQESQKFQRTYDFAESNYLAQLNFVRTKCAS